MGIASTSYNLTWNSSFIPILKGIWNHSPRIQPCLSHARPLQAIDGIFLAFNPPMYFQKTNGTWSYPVFVNFVRSISVFHPFFFPKNLNFSWRFFQKLEDHHINPTQKIHQFPCVFFPVCLRFASRSQCKAAWKFQGAAYRATWWWWRISFERSSVMCIFTPWKKYRCTMMYICVRIHVSGKHFFFGGGAARILHKPAKWPGTLNKTCIHNTNTKDVFGVPCLFLGGVAKKSSLKKS